MNRFSEMLLALDVYRGKIDKVIEEYLGEEARIKDTYTEGAGKPLHEKNLAKAQTVFAAKQQEITLRVNSILDDVQTELKNYLVSALPTDKTFALLSLLLSSGIKLSSAEIESLQSSLGNNYFCCRILGELATRSGVNGIRAPLDLDLLLGILHRVRDEADIFVAGYCGAKPVQELFTDKNTPVSKNLVYAAAAGRPFAPDSALLQASVIWDGDSIPTKHKSRLTADDLDVLNQMFKGCTTPEQLSGRTTQILSQTPEMREILAISPYSAFVPKEDAVP